MNRERRRHPRVPIDAQAFVTLADETYTAHLMDLASSGAQIECSEATLRHLTAAQSASSRPVELELMFNLPDDPAPVSVYCGITHNRPAEQGVLLGLLFSNIPALDAARIGQYLEQQFDDESDPA